MVTSGVTLSLTVIVTGALVAVGEVVQVAFEVITTVTTSPFVIVVEVKVGLSVPAFTPLTLHWYDGAAPPLVGVAVNVTHEPEHIVEPGFTAMLTLAGTIGFTLTVVDAVVEQPFALTVTVYVAVEPGQTIMVAFAPPGGLLH